MGTPANDSLKHTPGPWELSSDSQFVYGTSSEGKRIVVVYELNHNEADGRLIAAAPVVAAKADELVRTLNAAKILDGAGGYHAQAMEQMRELELLLAPLGYGRLAKATV